MSEIDRRAVLGGLAASGLAACAPGAGLGEGPAPSIEPGTIDHVVFLMMENRSFDHVFGSYSLVEGRTEVDGLQPGMANLDLAGRRIEPAPLVEPCTQNDPPHGWDSSRTQLDGGTCAGFVRAHQEKHGAEADPAPVMAYQTRAQQPISYALADRYALCQRWFSSVLSSTWPNRIYLHAGTNEGVRGNRFPKGQSFFTNPTLWDQLDGIGVDWGYYYTDLPTLALLARKSFVDRMQLIDAFYADAAAGTLPPVVGVDAGAAFNDDHPPHHPMLGQLFIGSIYRALATSPLWDRTLFVLTYDEAGGFFDHVPPPTTADDFAAEAFDQLGFRVPALVAGPYVPPSVSNLQLEHTAAMSFVQKRFGLGPLTLRNQVSGDLSELLDAAALAAGSPSAPIDLPAIARSEQEIEEECAALGRRSGQPELQDVVRALFPSLDRTSDLPATARRLWRRFGEQGLWVADPAVRWRSAAPGPRRA